MLSENHHDTDSSHSQQTGSGRERHHPNETDSEPAFRPHVPISFASEGEEGEMMGSRGFNLPPPQYSSHASSEVSPAMRVPQIVPDDEFPLLMPQAPDQRQQHQQQDLEESPLPAGVFALGTERSSRVTPGAAAAADDHTDHHLNSAAAGHLQGSDHLQKELRREGEPSPWGSAHHSAPPSGLEIRSTSPPPPPPPVFAENNEKLRSPTMTTMQRMNQAGGSGFVDLSKPVAAFPQAMPVPPPEVMVTMGMTLEEYHRQQQQQQEAGFSSPSDGGVGDQPADTPHTAGSQVTTTTGWRAKCWQPCVHPSTCVDALMCSCCLTGAHYDALFQEYRVQNPDNRNCNCAVASILCLASCFMGGGPMACAMGTEHCLACMCSTWGCLPVISGVTFVFRRLIRKRYNIRGHFGEVPVTHTNVQVCIEGAVDLLCSCFCVFCTLSQHHRELVIRGGYKGQVVFSHSGSIVAMQ